MNMNTNMTKSEYEYKQTKSSNYKFLNMLS